MKNILDKLIKNRKIAMVFVVMLVVAGVLAFIENPKQESPDFTIPYAMITTIYPGASQSDVDAYVTEPIENVLTTIDGYDTSTSYSSNSFSLIILELNFDADRDKSFSQLKEEMVSLQASLPEDCGEITVNTDITNTAGILLSLSSDTLTNREIIEQAEFIRDKLSDIEEFEKFDIMGNIETIVSVKVDEDKMKSAGLTLNDITNIIKANDIDMPIGNVTEDDQSITVNYTGGYKDIDEISSLKIGYSAQLQRILRLKDVADVSYQTNESNTYYTHNGDDAVIIAGFFEDGINILPLEKEINDVLDSIKDDLPDTLQTSLIISQPEEVDDSLIDFSKNLIWAVVLVILVVLVGMGFRNAVVVSVSLPLSLLISFSVMYLLDIKIHQVSIAALIVCLGMLVDNSIVVSDSIQGYLDDGMKRKKACIMGVKNVVTPVFASTITTVAAFLPFLFLNSIAGDYIKSLPQIISISLAASFLTAVLIIPIIGFMVFKPRKNSKKKRAFKFYKNLLKGSMKNKVLVFIAVIILVAASGYVAMQLDTIFFPASDKDIIYIDIKNNNSDDLASTINIVEQLSSMIDDEIGVVEYTTAAGGGVPRFNQIMYIYTNTADIGQIMMRVDLDKTTYDTNEDYKLALQDKIDQLNLDAKIVVKELMYAFPMDEDLKIRIVGDDLDMLKDYEAKIFTLLESKEGLVNVGKGNTNYVDEYDMQVISEQALMNGLLPAEVQNEISIALFGRQATTTKKDGYDIDVVVSGNYETYNDLLSIPIKTATGEYVTADTLIDIEKSNTLSTIPRYNGDYAMTLTADYDLDYDKNEILSEIKDEIDKINKDNLKITYEGEDALIKENFGQVGILGAVALAIVFLILTVQFSSLTMPLLIFITIPLSAVGSILGLYATGQPISFTALLGVVSLLGIVVNNAIILIDYIRKEESLGITTKKACINASLRRLRPIFLSTTTTVIGLIPLALSNSELFRPMAIALMSGLMVSTLLTLIVLPVLVSTVRKKNTEKVEVIE